MASLTPNPKNGSFRIQFTDANDLRRTIHLGKMSRRAAETIKAHVEELLSAQLARCSPSRETAAWVGSLGDDLHEKLVKAGLIAPRASATLGKFTREYIDSRTDAKHSTLVSLAVARARLIEYLGENRLLTSITRRDADLFLPWLMKRLSRSTAGRTIGYAKQFFHAAVRAELIPANPFDGIKALTESDRSRQVFIDRVTINKILDVIPCPELRLIVALARYGGLRIPSELFSLKWEDVLWDRGKFLVHSPKLEHHGSKADRWVPIFPELLPHFREVYERAEPGTIYVITRYRGSRMTLHVHLERYCRLAGVTPWPKLFINLRASRATELRRCRRWSIDQITAWLGHTAIIQDKHYVIVDGAVTDDDYLEASQSDVKSDVPVTSSERHGDVKSDADSVCLETTGEHKSNVVRELSSLLSSVDICGLQGDSITQRLDIFDATTLHANDLQNHPSESDVQTQDFPELLARKLLSLPMSTRQRIAALLTGQ